jgi:hypothetical protein
MFPVHTLEKSGIEAFQYTTVEILFVFRRSEESEKCACVCHSNQK